MDLATLATAAISALIGGGGVTLLKLKSSRANGRANDALLLEQIKSLARSERDAGVSAVEKTLQTGGDLTLAAMALQTIVLKEIRDGVRDLLAARRE